MKVINAGVSGDTTRGGKSRVGWAIGGDKPDVAIVQLGGNDMLRGFTPNETRTNMDAILSQLKAAKITTVVAGMRAAPNLGPEYVEAFEGLYVTLAKKHGATLYPFFLEGVALDPELNQADGIHPNARGVAEIVRRFLPTILEVLESVKPAN